MTIIQNNMRASPLRNLVCVVGVKYVTEFDTEDVSHYGWVDDKLKIHYMLDAAICPHCRRPLMRTPSDISREFPLQHVTMTNEEFIEWKLTHAIDL